MSHPHSLAELTTAAAEFVLPPSRSLRHYLRLSEQQRNAGRAYIASARSAGPEVVWLEREHTFIEFARAAKLILETIPALVEYQGDGVLTRRQKDNLAVVGVTINALVLM
jgi:predicted LPLAT superfamily acyltransferase